MDETTAASLLSRELVFMVSFGNGGSGIGLIVSLTPSELVSTGPLELLFPLELGTVAAAGGSGIALMCSFGIVGGVVVVVEDVDSSSFVTTTRLLWCE